MAKTSEKRTELGSELLQLGFSLKVPAQRSSADRLSLQSEV